MYIWAALGIPLITAAILAIFFHHRTKWWEFGAPLLASAIFVLGAKGCVEHTLTTDTEIWNDWVVQARYYEPWNEYIHQRCWVCTSRNKNGSCTGGYYRDCSYVRNHGPGWEVRTEGKKTIGVDQGTYNYFVKFFEQGQTFQELNRNYHTRDGDMYFTNWPQTVAKVEPVNLAYSYENRVQASRSVFKFEEISEEQAAKENLFGYPKVKTFDYPSILGDCGPYTKQANRELSVQNALLGAKKELRMWVLCTKNPDPNFGQRQESFWAGGNKNEAVVVIGVDDNYKPRWVHPFTWALDKTPLINIRDTTLQMPVLDPLALSQKMSAELEAGFKRRNFDEFNYLTVEPPFWACVLVIILTILVNAGVSYYVIINEHHDDDEDHKRDYSLSNRRNRYY